MKRFFAHHTPKRYIFTDPDTGYQYSAPSKKLLMDHIISYREQNRLEPILHLDLVLDTYLCNLPENARLCKEVKLKRGLLQYIQGGVALVENLFYGERNMVSEDVAKRRAKICMGCPHNVFPDKGAFIEWADSMAEAATGGKRIEETDKLGNCEVCSCPLRAKIWHKGPFKLLKQEKQKLPGFCWQLKHRKTNA